MAEKSCISNFSDEAFAELVANSYSITEVTRKCGYKTYRSGGGREKVRSRIKILELDTSHFRTTGRQFEKPPHNKILNISDVLKRGSDTNRITVRDIVIREGLLPYRCDECGNTGIWNGRELVLQLHHIDGDSTNNEITNLMFLCPNCHSQTDNYSYKNAKHNEKRKFYCAVCGKQISNFTRTGRCKSCAAKLHMIEKPSKEELIHVIQDIKFKKYICFYYGISDKTLDQWLIYYNLPTHIAELHQYLKEHNKKVN